MTAYRQERSKTPRQWRFAAIARSLTKQSWTFRDRGGGIARDDSSLSTCLHCG
jgi:hypothetical protein